MAYRASVRTVQTLLVSPRLPVPAQRQLSIPPNIEGRRTSGNNNEGARLLKSTSMERTTRRDVSGTTPQPGEGAQTTGASATSMETSIITNYIMSPKLLKNLPDKASGYPDTEFRKKAYSGSTTRFSMETLPICGSVWPHLW